MPFFQHPLDIPRRCDPYFLRDEEMLTPTAPTSPRSRFPDPALSLRPALDATPAQPGDRDRFLPPVADGARAGLPFPGRDRAAPRVAPHLVRRAAVRRKARRRRA